MQCFFEQQKEDAVPGKKPQVAVLHVHAGMKVNELAERAIIVYHVESADVARLFCVGE